MKSISLIIPAYNEESRIGKSLEKIIGHLETQKHDYEIIIVDDGSTDKMIDAIKEFKNEKINIIKNEKNKGKGYSVKQGIMNAEKDLILITDSDLSTPIEELEKFLKIKDCDILIGSRALKDSKIPIPQSFIRRTGGKAINVLIQIFLLPGLKDTQCGFKLFKRGVAKTIFPKQTINRWGFDFEVLFIAKKLGYKIKEIPVTWENDMRTTVNPFRDGLRILLDIVKIRLNNLKGLYN